MRRGFIEAGNGQDINDKRYTMNIEKFWILQDIDRFTQQHPVLVGERKGTDVIERLERIRTRSRKRSVVEQAEKFILRAQEVLA